MTKTAPRAERRIRRPARPAMTMKWLVVLAALSVATVLDGISISNLSKPSGGATIEQAAITLPSDRCAADCTIMVASNQPGGQLQ